MTDPKTQDESDNVSAARLRDLEAHASELRAQVAEMERLLVQAIAERDRFRDLYSRALQGARQRGRGAELPSVEEVAMQREGLALADKAEIVERALERVRATREARNPYTQGNLL